MFEAFPCDIGPCVGVSNTQEAGVEEGKEKECVVCTIFTCAELELYTTMMINDSVNDINHHKIYLSFRSLDAINISATCCA